MSGLRNTIAFLFAAVAVVYGAAVPARAGAEDWSAVADGVLMPALRDAYPEVAQWSVTALVGKAQRERLQGATDITAAVARVGKRSAVKLSWTQGGRRATTTVWFSVAGVQSVLTARSMVRAGAALAPELAEAGDRDVVALACATLSAPAALSGMRTKRTLHAGAAICGEAIERRPPVSRGEDVIVHSVAGAVTITAKAVAQQDGALGQVLRVRNPSNGEIYLASVSAEGEVVVHE